MRKFFLRFPQEILGEPVLYNLGKKFSVIPNIRGASIGPDKALMAVELHGDDDEVDRALAWLTMRGVGVEPLRPGQEHSLEGPNQPIPDVSTTPPRNS